MELIECVDLGAGRAVKVFVIVVLVVMVEVLVLPTPLDAGLVGLRAEIEVPFDGVALRTALIALRGGDAFGLAVAGGATINRGFGPAALADATFRVKLFGPSSADDALVADFGADVIGRARTGALGPDAETDPPVVDPFAPCLLTIVLADTLGLFSGAVAGRVLVKFALGMPFALGAALLLSGFLVAVVNPADEGLLTPIVVFPAAGAVRGRAVATFVAPEAGIAALSFLLVERPTDGFGLATVFIAGFFASAELGLPLMLASVVLVEIAAFSSSCFLFVCKSDSLDGKATSTAVGSLSAESMGSGLTGTNPCWSSRSNSSSF